MISLRIVGNEVALARRAGDPAVLLRGSLRSARAEPTRFLVTASSGTRRTSSAAHPLAARGIRNFVNSPSRADYTARVAVSADVEAVCCTPAHPQVDLVGHASGTDRAIHRDGRQPRPPGRDARAPVLRNAHPAARAGGFGRTTPSSSHPIRSRTARAHRPGAMRARSCCTTRRYGGGRAVPELPSPVSLPSPPPPSRHELPRPTTPRRGHAAATGQALHAVYWPADAWPNATSRYETPPLARRSVARSAISSPPGARRDVAPAVRDRWTWVSTQIPGGRRPRDDQLAVRPTPGKAESASRSAARDLGAVEQRAARRGGFAPSSDRIRPGRCAFDRPREHRRSAAGVRASGRAAARRPRRLVSRAQ